jgi:hypothetical protein
VYVVVLIFQCAPPQIEQEWQRAYPDINTMLLRYLAQKKVALAKWRESTAEQRKTLLDMWAHRYTGEWLGACDMFLIGIPGKLPL